MKQRSMFWHTLASLDIPTGLYACKRVNKFRLGCIVYFTTYLAFVFGSWEAAPLIYKGIIGILWYGLGTLSLGVMAIIIPVLFVRRWTKEFNKALVI